MNAGTAAAGGGALLTVGIIVAFCVFFPLLWISIVTLMSRVGGWHGLAQTYAHPETPAGEAYRGQTAVFGLARYKGVVTAVLAERGLHLSVFFLFEMSHPPLLIPWDDIESVETSSWLFSTCARVKLSKHSGKTIDLYGTVGEPLKIAFSKSRPVAAAT